MRHFSNKVITPLQNAYVSDTTAARLLATSTKMVRSQLMTRELNGFFEGSKARVSLAQIKAILTKQKKAQRLSVLRTKSIFERRELEALPPYLAPAHAAKKLGFSRKKFDLLRKSGKIPSRNVILGPGKRPLRTYCPYDVASVARTFQITWYSEQLPPKALYRRCDEVLNMKSFFSSFDIARLLTISPRAATSMFCSKVLPCDKKSGLTPYVSRENFIKYCRHHGIGLFGTQIQAVQILYVRSGEITPKQSTFVNYLNTKIGLPVTHCYAPHATDLYSMLDTRSYLGAVLLLDNPTPELASEVLMQSMQLQACKIEMPIVCLGMSNNRLSFLPEALRSFEGARATRPLVGRILDVLTFELEMARGDFFRERLHDPLNKHNDT